MKPELLIAQQTVMYM